MLPLELEDGADSHRCPRYAIFGLEILVCVEQHCYGRTTLSEVYASEAPNIIESIGSEVWDDIHCNILGLPGIAMKVREV